MEQRISFPLACVFLCLTSCHASGAEQTFFAMGTVMSVQVSGRRGLQAMATTQEAVERLDGLLSRTDSDSQIARLSAAAGDDAAVTVDSGMTRLLAFSQGIVRQLPGDSNITIAPVMGARGFTAEERHVPAPNALAAATALVDSKELSVDTKASVVSLAHAGMEVDLGAMTEGLAARKAEAAIQDAGGTSAMLDLGSNVTVIGAKEDGPPWRVAVKDPRDIGSCLYILALTDVALSISGSYECYFGKSGVRYHHITNPETGYPTDSDLLSVTVVSADRLLTGTLSTALFVAGPEEALGFWWNRGDFELVLYTGQRELLVIEGLEDAFTSAGADRGYTYEITHR